MANNTPSHNPRLLAAGLREMSRGMRKHHHNWSSRKAHPPEELEDAARELEDLQAEVARVEQDLQQARLALRRARLGRAKQLYRHTREVVRLYCDRDRADFGLAPPQQPRRATQPPSEPEKLVAQATGMTSIRLKWKPQGRTASYQVCMGTTDNPAEMKMVAGCNAARVVISGLSPGSSYFCSVLAVRSGLQGEYSEPLALATRRSTLPGQEDALQGGQAASRQAGPAGYPA